MKRNIFENNNILNKDEIQEFLDACGYDKKWSIDKNNEITLNADFKTHPNLDLFMKSKNITTLPFKIKRAKNFIIHNTSMNNYDFAPSISSILSFSSVTLKSPSKSIDLHISKTNELLFVSVKNFKVLNIISKPKISALYIFSCLDLEYIDINKETHPIDIVLLRGCGKLSLENINLPHFIRLLTLEELDNVKTFDEHNETIVDKLSIYTLKNLESWRNIDKFDIKEYLHILFTPQLNNFINVMLLKTDKITNDNQKIDFFKKYSEIQNRQDYIMDFAVELIDAGLDEAAEL